MTGVDATDFNSVQVEFQLMRNKRHDQVWVKQIKPSRSSKDHKTESASNHENQDEQNSQHWQVDAAFMMNERFHGRISGETGMPSR